MKKQEFLKRLSAGMAELPLLERHKRIKKYRVQMEDRLRQGESEEEIIAAFPPPEEICREALEEIPERRKPLSAAQKAMLTAAAVLTSPLWIGAALIAAGAALVCYVLLWLSIAAVFLLVLGLAVAFVTGIVSSLIFFPSNAAAGGLQMGLSLICGSLSVLLLAAGVKLIGWVRKADRKIRRKTKEFLRRRMASL